MNSCEADFAQITLTIQRMLDAELIAVESGTALLEEADAGRRLVELGDQEVARQHAERLAALIVALVGSGELGLHEGRAVIETVGGMLSSARQSNIEQSKGERKCSESSL